MKHRLIARTRLQLAGGYRPTDEVVWEFDSYNEAVGQHVIWSALMAEQVQERRDFGGTWVVPDTIDELDLRTAWGRS